MPGLFEDLGRSNALTEATGNLTNLAVGLRREDRLAAAAAEESKVRGLQLQTEQINLNAAKRQEEEAVKTHERMNAPVLLDDLLGGFTPTTRQQVKQQMLKMGLATESNGVAISTRAYGKIGLDWLHQDTEEAHRFRTDAATNTIEDLKQSLAQDGELLAAGKGKPEDLKAIQQRVLATKQRLTGLVRDQIQYDQAFQEKVLLQNIKEGIGPVSPGDFTPASMAKFKASGNYADLVPLDKTKIGDVPGHVKEAQGLVTSIFAKINPTLDPLTAQMMASNPDLLAAMKPTIPPELQATYDNATKIIGGYYSSKVPATEKRAAGAPAGVTYIRDPKTGALVPQGK